MPCLVISVHFHDGRYHGRPEWPPSPARLFQALVAGAARGATIGEEDRSAFAWLETLEAPVIAVPSMRAGQGFTNFVPNNDLDAVDGDPARIGEIRAPKLIRPILFDTGTPLLYAWRFPESSEAQARSARVIGIAQQLYQLGRGVDMAWARGEMLAAEQVEARLLAYSGAVHRPSNGTGGETLAVPVKGSIGSLVDRYSSVRARFQTLYLLKPTKSDPNRKVPAGQLFVQPPRARFQQVAYDSPPLRLLFDLSNDMAWPLDRVVELTEQVRDRVAQRLKEALSSEAGQIENAIVGRREAGEADKAARVRITPIPSIGHRYADHAIRRVLVEIPPNCPLGSGDLEWAFSGAPLVSDQGEVLCELAFATDLGMLRHYGMETDETSRLWRTVTPAALPEQARRRRIDPARRRAEAKGGPERAEEELKAVTAVMQALRHAGISARPLTIGVQREPFEAKSARVEAFAPGTRFAKERLWHVELAFQEGLRGPLILGDGRYLGLGLMSPVRAPRRDVVVYSLAGNARVSLADRPDLLRAVRRALMALARDEKGNVPPLFSGHEPDGARASSGRHRHVFLGCADLDGDGGIDRLIVAAPWVCDRWVRPEPGERRAFDRVTASLVQVRAGKLGVIALRSSSADGKLDGTARIWESRTDYRPTRHAGRGKDPSAALLRDVAAECDRRRLPKPAIELLHLSVGPKEGVAARLRLRFAVAVRGPILLGRDSHQGGGLFAASD